MKWNSLIIFSLLLLTACSQKGSNVELKVSSNFVFGGSSMQSISGGGLMVWGQSTTGESFGQAVENNDELKLSLKNGTWTFYAMAWDGSKYYTGSNNSNNDTPFGGVARCGKSLQTNLDGNAVSVSLTVDTAGCASNDFLGTAVITSGEMPKLKMRFCSDLTNIASPAHVCTDDPSTANHKSYRAPVGSYRIKLNQFQNTTKLADGVKSMCVSADGLTGLPNLPAGGNGFPFKMTLEYYLTTTDCELSGTVIRGMQSLELPVGVAQATSSSKYFTDGTTHYQFVELTPAKVCAGRTATTLGGHPFAAGDGSVVNPYVICSVPQWHAINDNAAMNKSYKLQANLDFNPYSVGLGIPTLPAQASCLELGTNFLPLGYLSASCPTPGGDLVWDSVTPFSGNIFGNGFTFKNLRLRAEDRNHIGLIAHVQSASSKIIDFNMEKPEISGRFRVGAIAGEVDGLGGTVNDVVISKIKIKNMDIEGRAKSGDNTGATDVGGLVGYFQDGTISNIFIDGKVRGETNRIGGVVGLLANTTFMKVSAEIDIDANSGVSKIEVGGLIGRAEGSSLYLVKHEGGIQMNGTTVGGIAGSINNNTSLINFYTISSITTNDGTPNNRLGGVVGLWASGTNAASLSYGYSLSQVRSNCTSNCSQGSVTGEVSGTLPATGPIYILSAANSGAGTNPGVTPNGLSEKTLADIKTIGALPGLTYTGSDDWDFVNGVYPRFDFEYHPCSTGMNGTGAGTSSSPKIICSDDQYFTNASIAGQSNKLMANIRIENTSTTQYDIPNFNAKLNGNNKALIGGYGAFANSAFTSHIGTLPSTASITNLRIHGMGRSRDYSSTTCSPASVFVNNNQGLLQNIFANTHGYYRNCGSGLVGTNNGTMRKIHYRGVIQGESSLSSIAFKNSGIIEDADVSGEIQCRFAACAFVSGIVLQNYGSLSKIKAGTHFQDAIGRATNHMSFLVDENHGVIQDVVVPRYTVFRNHGYGAHYYHRINGPGASLNRVAVFGKLLFGEFNPGVAMNDFPNATTAASVDQGTHTNVFRSGVSGKELLMEVPYTCSSTNVIVDSTAWSTLSSWVSTFSGYNGLAPADKKMIVVLNQDGKQQTFHVTNTSGNSLTIAGPGCFPSGKLSLYWTDDIMVSPNSTTQLAEVMLPQYGANPANYGGDWRAKMWDANNSADRDAMMAYYAFMLGVSSTNPGTPAIWEMDEDGELSLFDLD